MHGYRNTPSLLGFFYMSYSLNSWYPLNKPYTSPLYNSLYNLPLRSLDYSSHVSNTNKPAFKLEAKAIDLLIEFWVGFRNQGYHFGGPHKMDCSILGSILGSPYFEKPPFPSMETDMLTLSNVFKTPRHQSQSYYSYYTKLGPNPPGQLPALRV